MKRQKKKSHRGQDGFDQRIEVLVKMQKKKKKKTGGSGREGASGWL